MRKKVDCILWQAELKSYIQRQEGSYDNFGCYTVQYNRVSNKYVKYFRGALTSLFAKQVHN